MKRRGFLFLTGLSLLTACALILHSRTEQVLAQGPPGADMPPPQVTTAPVELKTHPVSFEYVGATSASKTIEIRARVQGFIESRDFQDGAWVETGEQLFTIDARPYEADQEIAAAQVQQAEARLQLAKQELERLRAVRTPGAVAATEIDLREAEVSSATANLRLAKAQLEKARLNVEYTTVSAPLTGFVGKALKEIGSYVDSGANTLLTTMEQVEPLYVSFPMPESDYLAWKRETGEGKVVFAEGVDAPVVEVTLYDGRLFGERGVLDYEDVSVAQQTGTVELRATFANAEHVLKPGQFVKVRLSGWVRPDVLTVPQRAVSQSPRGAYVYVVNGDSKVEMRPVTLGAQAEDGWELLDGVQVGEQVIVEGLTKVRPGTEVAVGPPPGTPPAQGQDAAPGSKQQT